MIYPVVLYTETRLLIVKINLSNLWMPVFYLFEKSTDQTEAQGLIFKSTNGVFGQKLQ